MHYCYCCSLLLGMRHIVQKYTRELLSVYKTINECYEHHVKYTEKSYREHPPGSVVLKRLQQNTLTICACVCDCV